ncbi:MAG TPA: hypothetical protein VFO94_02515, partial [Gammaproteobacteria bacterium]|nr:hypothetical protein [Gammaproteobacteria bacterium]
MHRSRVATVGILGLLALFAVTSTAQPGSTTAEAYRPPRTSWGDPSLEGKWPSTNMASVPLQRPES